MIVTFANVLIDVYFHKICHCLHLLFHAGTIIGVNHKLTLDCAYFVVALNVGLVKGKEILQTVWLLDSDLTGSAMRYLPYAPQTIENPKVFESLIAIDVFPAGGCRTHRHPQWCIELNETVQDHASVLVPLERVYSVKETAIGPDANTTIPPTMMLFQLTTL